jgi:hypothetical protein
MKRRSAYMTSWERRDLKARVPVVAQEELDLISFHSSSNSKAVEGQEAVQGCSLTLEGPAEVAAQEGLRTFLKCSVQCLEEEVGALVGQALVNRTLEDLEEGQETSSKERSPRQKISSLLMIQIPRSLKSRPRR